MICSRDLRIGIFSFSPPDDEDEGDGGMEENEDDNEEPNDEVPDEELPEEDFGDFSDEDDEE